MKHFSELGYNGEMDENVILYPLPPNVLETYKVLFTIGAETKH